MTRLITTNDDKHRLWVCMRLGLGAAAFQDTIGSVALEDENGQIYAAVIYTNYMDFQETGGSLVWASIAALPGVYWCTPRFLKAILAYPFEVLGVSVLRTQCRRRNKEARRFNEKIGMTFAGIARRSWDGKQDTAHYDMLPHEAAKWLGYEPKPIDATQEVNHGRR